MELHKSEKILSGPPREALKVMGQFQGHFVYKTRTASQPVYVVDGLKTNLLGLPTITALNLAARIDALTGVSEQDIPKQFPLLFKGLGNLGEEYHIQLKPEAKPFGIYTPRHVPLPLRDKVQKARQNGIFRGNLTSRPANTVVHGHGGRTQEKQSC